MLLEDPLIVPGLGPESGMVKTSDSWGVGVSGGGLEGRMPEFRGKRI